nr:MAG TPA: hypothetical protein [Caudoviricetes sp.]
MTNQRKRGLSLSLSTDSVPRRLRSILQHCL